MGLVMRTKITGILDKGIWAAEITRKELSYLGNPLMGRGQRSVILVDTPTWDSDNSQLEFSPSSACVLNLGEQSSAIIIDSGLDREEGNIMTHIAKNNQPTFGDQQFLLQLDKVPPGLRRLGKQLLSGVRTQYQGELEFKTRSGRFVETPENFWTIRVQPRAKSLRITVYGQPNSFSGYSDLVIKKDRGSYSSFIIHEEKQLEPALKVIMDALYLKRGRM